MQDPHWNSTQWEALLFMAEEGNANLTSSGFLQILHVGSLKGHTQKHQVVNLSNIFTTLVIAHEKLNVLHILELDKLERDYFLTIQLFACQNNILYTGHSLCSCEVQSVWKILEDPDGFGATVGRSLYLQGLQESSKHSGLHRSRVGRRG